MAEVWVPGKPIKVRANKFGMPISIYFEDRWHSVAIVNDDWRPDTDWWVDRKWRHYFHIITETNVSGSFASTVLANA